MNKGPGNWFNGLPRTEFTTLDLCGGWREPVHSPPNIQPPNTQTLKSKFPIYLYMFSRILPHLSHLTVFPLITTCISQQVSPLYLIDIWFIVFCNELQSIAVKPIEC